MKLVLQPGVTDLKAAPILFANDVPLYVTRLGLQLVSKADNMPAILRAAGARHMRFDKKEEQYFGPFAKGETYKDSDYEYHFLYFQNSVALLCCELAMRRYVLCFLDYGGLPEKRFEEKPLYYIGFLGYEPDPEELTLETAGMNKSVKALYGKPKWVRRYRLGDNVLKVAEFQTKTYIEYGSEAQLKFVYRELGIIYSKERLERRVLQLIGSGSGLLRFVLLNSGVVNAVINVDQPGWLAELYSNCELSGGAVSVDPATAAPGLYRA